MSEEMTKSERSELCQLIRKREKVMKSMAVERSAKLIAEFELQVSREYSFDEDDTWKGAHKQAEEAAIEANKIIRLRCAELGIPGEFSPQLSLGWEERGKNEVEHRRREMRSVARTKISALEKEALTKIERSSLQAQTEVIANGLRSKSAKAFLESMPTLEALMPELDFRSIKQLNDQNHRSEE